MICKKCQTQNAPHMSKCFACGYTKFTESTPFSRRHENGFNPNLPTCGEASEAFKKLGESISTQPKCNHGIWVGTECVECIKECRDEFFKNNGENHV